MRRLSLVLAVLSLFVLPGLAPAKPSWTVTGKITKSWGRSLAVRHTANLLGNKRFSLTFVRSGRDKLYTDHYRATPARGASFKPFAVHVQRAKIKPAIIAPKGTSRVSFSALKGLYGYKKK
jgi:hypothetical protein